MGALRSILDTSSGRIWVCETCGLARSEVGTCTPGCTGEWTAYVPEPSPIPVFADAVEKVRAAMRTQGEMRQGMGKLQLRRCERALQLALDDLRTAKKD